MPHLFKVAIFLILATLPLKTPHAVPAEGQIVAISGPSSYAVEAALSIIEMGGNAVDASVTGALVLAVTSPYYASLGGGGFAIVSSGDQTRALDFREVAPQATHKKYFEKLPREASWTGGKAVGVPGVPAGLYELHQRYGKLHWSRLFDSAIELATKGFPISGEWARITQNNHKRFDENGKNHFLKKDEQLYIPGDILRQPGLARLLREMRNRGAIAFYQGAAGRDLVQSVKNSGGELALSDLADYKPIWRDPILANFQGYEIALMPPPSSGGLLIQGALSLMEKLEVQKLAPLSIQEFHTLGEIQRFVFRGRTELGDPTFHSNEVRPHLSEQALDGFVGSFNPKARAEIPAPVPLSVFDEVTESTETTHLSVLTKDRGAVSMTLTLNGFYGSGVVTERFGVALNNEMDDFTTRTGKPNMFGLVQGEGNVVEPHKRPLSSMSPTIVLKNGTPVMSIGAPGGPKIINGVLQVLYRVLIQNWNMDEAIQAPRVHHQFLPDKLFADPKKFSPEVLEGLKALGHTLEEASIARVYGARLNERGLLEAAHDLRGEGASAAR